MPHHHNEHAYQKSCCTPKTFQYKSNLKSACAPGKTAQDNYHKLDWEPRDFSHREQSDIPSGIRILSPVHMPILLQGHKVGGAGFEPARPIKRNGFTVRRHRPNSAHPPIVPVVGLEPT